MLLRRRNGKVVAIAPLVEVTGVKADFCKMYVHKVFMDFVYNPKDIVGNSKAKKVSDLDK